MSSLMDSAYPIRHARRGYNTDVTADPVKRKNIVLVENDSLMLRAIERLLRVRGFDVESFTSAEAFLDRGTAIDAACLLLDVNLGGMSGVALQRKLLESGSRLPVIFMTAFDSENTRREAVDAGCAAYLLKPFSASDLVAAISAASG